MGTQTAEGDYDPYEFMEPPHSPQLLISKLLNKLLSYLNHCYFEIFLLYAVRVLTNSNPNNHCLVHYFTKQISFINQNMLGTMLIIDEEVDKIRSLN